MIRHLLDIFISCAPRKEVIDVKIRSRTGKVHAVITLEKVGDLWKGRTKCGKTILGQLTEEPITCEVCSLADGMVGRLLPY